MEEKLYTIPVKEAFEKDCECPICKMYESIERMSVEFTMGPSYMEDDVRFATDEKGFCDRHMDQLYKYNNRLGLAIILNTHIQKTTFEIEKLASNATGGGFFKKKNYSGVTDYIDKLNSSCFICERVNNTFERYIATIYHLWKNDKVFVTKYNSSKGFCTKHYGMLIKGAKDHLMGNSYEEFIEATNKLYIDNMKRINEDVSWFIDKFDYRFKDAPWKNSKDALPRAVIKTVSFDENEEEGK